MRPIPEASRLEPMNVVAAPGVPSEVPVGDSRTASVDGEARLGPAWCFLAAPAAAALAVAGLIIGAGDGGPTPTQIIGAILVGLWAAAGIFLGLRRPQDRLGPIVLAGAVAGGVLSLAQSLTAHAEFEGTTAEPAAIAVRLTACLLPALALHLFTALPDGRLASPGRRAGVIAGYLVALLVGAVLCSDLDDVTVWPVVALWTAALGFGVYATSLRYRTAGAVERRRIQWIGWGLTVAAEAVLVVIALRLLTDWPHVAGRGCAGRHGTRADRDHRRHGAEDGGACRSSAHAHGRPRRVDRVDPGDLRDGGARSRPDARGWRTDAVVAVDGGRRSCGAAVPAGPALVDRAGEPARVRRRAWPRTRR